MLQLSFLCLAIGLVSGWFATVRDGAVSTIFFTILAAMFGGAGVVGISRRKRRIVALRVDEFGIGFGGRKDVRIPWNRLGDVGIAQNRHNGMVYETVLRFRIKGRIADGTGRGATSGLPGGLFASSQYDMNDAGLTIPLERIAEAVERLRERYA